MDSFFFWNSIWTPKASNAQVISYKLAMGLSLVTLFLYVGLMSTSEIVVAQSSWLHSVDLFISSTIFTVSMVGVANREPFDLAEVEGWFVFGFHTEYSPLKFALFFLAQYVKIVAVFVLATSLFW